MFGKGTTAIKSLPSRERELKLCSSLCINGMTFVAPFAGARVETLVRVFSRIIDGVAPFAGARVETI